MLSKKNLSSKITILALAGLLVFLGDLKFKQYQNQQNIEKQTQKLRAQADALQKQNDDLNQSLQYLTSPSFKERVAREQLNYKKEGEVVYGFTDAPQASGSSQTSQGGSSNLKRWWDYFFGD